MRLLRGFVGLVSACVLAAASAVLLAPAANAESGWSWTYQVMVNQETYLAYKGGSNAASFVAENSGNAVRITLVDRKADGRGLRTYWRYNNTTGTCVNEKGSGKSQSCTIAVPDGVQLYYQHCMKNGSTNVSCSRSDSILG